MNPRYYFIQYWATTNPKILTFDGLREALYEIYLEIWEKVPNWKENKIVIVNNRFKQRVLAGRQCNIPEWA